MHSAGDNGTWLCPTPMDRTRLLDMEARLSSARAVMYGALGVALIICAPRLGWWTLIPLAISAAAYQALRPFIARSDRPEYIVALSVVIAQVLIGIGIGLTGGPTSPLLVMLLLPIVTLPARFGTRGVQAGVVATIAILALCTIGVDPQTFMAHPEPFIISVAALFGLAAFADTLMRAEIEQRSDSLLDPLTGLLNRKALVVHFDEIRRQAEMTGRPVCFVIGDLDHFKEVNDELGHGTGDAVLRDVASAMRARLRTSELLYRVGGEEFLLVLPGVAADGGAIVAERVRQAIAGATLGGVHITISIGVAVASGADVEFEALYEAADRALYEAKRGGRDMVIVAPTIRLVDEPAELAPHAAAPSARSSYHPNRVRPVPPNPKRVSAVPLCGTRPTRLTATGTAGTRLRSLSGR